MIILTSGEPSLNRIDLQTLTLVGPTGNVPVLDPLAALQIDNQLFMLQFLTLPFRIIFLDIFKPKYFLPHQSSY